MRIYQQHNNINIRNNINTIILSSSSSCGGHEVAVAVSTSSSSFTCVYSQQCDNDNIVWVSSEGHTSETPSCVQCSIHPVSIIVQPRRRRYSPLFIFFLSSSYRLNSAVGRHMSRQQVRQFDLECDLPCKYRGWLWMWTFVFKNRRAVWIGTKWLR